MIVRISKSRLILLAWSILWLLVVPLVHAHPGLHHHGGDTIHDHGAVVHSVFSSDHDDEPIAHEHASSDIDDPSSDRYPYGHAPHLFGQQEISFSLLTASIEWPTVFASTVVAETVDASSLLRQRIVAATSSPPVKHPTSIYLSKALPLRAPPGAL